MNFFVRYTQQKEYNHLDRQSGIKLLKEQNLVEFAGKF
jgi:hypothetical protein